MQGTCMDACAMQHNLAPHINSDHYVQPTSPQPQTATDVIKNHNAHEREVNNAIDQAFPVQYLKDMVPAQTMNQRTNEVKCNGKLLRRSESGRKMGKHSHRLKNTNQSIMHLHAPIVDHPFTLQPQHGLLTMIS